jgi:hypothetical protein
MRGNKWDPCDGPDAEEDAKPARDLRLDLERRGLSPAVSEPVAARLAALAAGLAPDEYAEFVDGLVVTYAAARDEGGDARQVAKVAELKRLLQGFHQELAKLDEALGTLSAYVARMRTRTASRRRPILH